MIFDDENVNQAIEFRTNRQKHTDFFFKLHDLKERIEVFNTIFTSKQPKFMHYEYQLKVPIPSLILLEEGIDEAEEAH